MMYCSCGGRTDWTKACDTSACLGTQFLSAAMERRRRSSSWDKTGAKQSLLDHSWGSRLPRTTILYLHRIGLPSLSFFNVARAMDGSAGPVTFFNSLYSSSVMISQVPRSRIKFFSVGSIPKNFILRWKARVMDGAMMLALCLLRDHLLIFFCRWRRRGVSFFERCRMF